MVHTVIAAPPPRTRIGAHHLPTTLIGLDRWLQELWADKERLLAAFHGDSRYQDESSSPPPPPFLFPASGQLQGRPRAIMPMQFLALVRRKKLLQ